MNRNEYDILNLLHRLLTATTIEAMAKKGLTNKELEQNSDALTMTDKVLTQYEIDNGLLQEEDEEIEEETLPAINLPTNKKLN